jgi:hypothetical protein
LNKVLIQDESCFLAKKFHLNAIEALNEILELDIQDFKARIYIFGV